MGDDLAWDRLALAASQIGLWWWDQRSGEVHWDTTLEAVYGLEPGGFAGTFDAWIERVHPEDREEVLEQLNATLAGDDSHYLLFRTIRPDQTVRWIESRGTVVRGAAGGTIGMTGACQDITERQETEARRHLTEQRLRERFEFLSQASQVLSQASTDVDAALQEFTSLVVPRLSDWCAVDLGDQAGALHLAAVSHADSAKVELVRTMLRRYGRSPDLGAGRVVRTGRSEHLPQVSDELLTRVAEDDEHLAMLRQLGLVSAVVVPLRARGRTLGALTLVHAESGRQHDHDDVVLAGELARRAAMAVDNARLLAERTRTAAMLQRALLPPELPRIPGVELAGLYDPAQKGEIGGDFYDAIGAGDRWTLVVGDVCGKGVGAASLTSLARHTVRAAALQDPAPTEVIGVLNEALCHNDAEDAFCTAVCAHLDVLDDGVRLTVASGGHPPPLILRGDGGVEEVGSSGLLLGCFDDVEIDPAEVLLHRGDLAVFYTDGITEARRDEELFGTERLQAALAEAAGLDAEATLKHVHAAVEAWQSAQGDDIALIACRATG